MAESDIVLEISLESKDVEKSLKKIEIKAKDAGQTIESDINAPLESSLQTLQKINNSVNNVVNGFENAARIFNVVARIAKLDIFGRFISKDDQKRVQLFASEFQEVADIVSNIRNEPLESIEQATDKAEEALSRFKKTALISTASLAGLGTTLVVTSKNYLEFRKGFLEGIALGQQFRADVTKTGTTLKQVFGFVPQKFGANIFGLVDLLGGVAISLGVVGSALKESESKFLRFVGTISLVAAAISGTLSLAVIKLVSELGNLAFNVGSKLVGVFQKASLSFAKFEKQTLIFTRTIEGFSKVFGGGLGTVDEFSQKIDEISQRTGIATGELRKSAAEVFAAGSQLNLTSEQAQKLLDVIVDYSTITGDVFQTTVDFVGALQGSTQSVIKYGVKLNDASVQNALFSKGLNVNINKLSSFEKEQARLLKVLTLYPTVAGKAEAVSNTLAGAQQRLNTNIERLNVSLGRGASIVENYNLASFALAKVLDSISNSVFEAVGFLGALGSRFLQVTGLAFKFSFTLVGIVKAVTILDSLLSTKTFQTFASKRLPLINQSLRETLLLLGATNVKLSSTKDILITLGQLTQRIFLSATNIILGTNLQFLTLSGILSGIYARSVQIARLATLKLVAAFKFFLANPIGLAITAAVGVFVLLRKALIFLEDQTRAFTKTYEIFLQAWRETSTFLQPVFDLFEQFADFLATKFFQAVGLVTVGISKLFSLLLNIAKADPFGLFSKKTIAGLTEVQKSLDVLSDKVIKVDFDIRKLGSPVETGEDPLKQTRDNIKGLQVDLVNLDDELGRVVDQGSFSAALSRIRDGSLTLQDVVREGLGGAVNLIKTQASIVSSAVNNLVVEGFSRLGAALVQGEKGFAGFAKSVAGIMGDFFIQLGTTIIAADQAIIALKASLLSFFGGAGIIAGAGLIIAGGALKALSGGPSGSPGGGAEAISAGPDNLDSIGAPNVDGVDEDQFESRGPSVSVVVQGNVLDRRETGLELAEIIRESFDGNAVVFNS